MQNRRSLHSGFDSGLSTREQGGQQGAFSKTVKISLGKFFFRKNKKKLGICSLVCQAKCSFLTKKSECSFTHLKKRVNCSFCKERRLFQLFLYRGTRANHSSKERLERFAAIALFKRSTRVKERIPIPQPCQRQSIFTNQQSAHCGHGKCTSSEFIFLSQVMMGIIKCFILC